MKSLISICIFALLANLSFNSYSVEKVKTKAKYGAISYQNKDIYLNGFNVAWMTFAKDVGQGFDEQKWRNVLEDVKKAGGNSVRWWIHTDGSLTPSWGTVNGERLVIAPGGSFIEDMKKALDIAAEYQVYIIPCLWSFDMLHFNKHRQTPTKDNYRLLTEPKVLDSYLNNALKPIVSALNKHPQLIAWELFNEPENMTEHWFVKREQVDANMIPTLSDLQRVQAEMAATIHAVALKHGKPALVTTGSKSLGKYNSDVAGGKNLYSDESLISAAGNNPLATFDFYAPHYYNNERKKGAWSPFHHDVSYWKLDKPIVIGEFYVKALDVLDKRIEGESLCSQLKKNGYAGGWSWQWRKEGALSGISSCIKKAND